MVPGVMCSMKMVRAPPFWVVDSSRWKWRWSQRRSADMVIEMEKREAFLDSGLNLFNMLPMEINKVL